MFRVLIAYAQSDPAVGYCQVGGVMMYCQVGEVVVHPPEVVVRLLSATLCISSFTIFHTAQLFLACIYYHHTAGHVFSDGAVPRIHARRGRILDAHCADEIPAAAAQGRI